MQKAEATNERKLPVAAIDKEVVVVGGGLAGVCCAITAARAGCAVVLVQDRPVLGGNASSEVRLWVLGATSHMGNNNRWAREGGVIDEILVENTYRNPEGNAVLFDALLLEKVIVEKNITLLLNTAVYTVEKSNAATISSVGAFCSQNQTEYRLSAPVFVDASGDGIVGFLSGAAFRMGAESKEEFGELFAPDQSYGELLGHSLYFYSKDVGKPVRFVPPSFALQDISKIPRYRSFNSSDFGCRLWWIEYGGRLDTVHQSEEIKWELWKVVYGVWNHIKNSGAFPEAETLTLEWVGTIPGKRESRRFEGDYMLKQQDIIEQRKFVDAVAFGGWSIDLHPADGVFSEKPGCNQWHSKGIYEIPYRCLYSKNISNLFLAGRIISASHVAFGSTRVMGTSACVGQAVGQAAVLCCQKNMVPRDLLTKNHIPELQQALLRQGHFIPGILSSDSEDLVQQAMLTASSALVLEKLSEEGRYQLTEAVAMMIPVATGSMPVISAHAFSDVPTELVIELRRSAGPGNYTPDVVLEKKVVSLTKGRNCLPLTWTVAFETPQYAYLVFLKNEAVALASSSQRITGVLSLFNTVNKAVSNYGRQEAPPAIGVDSFEFWVPKRRPLGENLSLSFQPALAAFHVDNIRNGIARPTTAPNAWVADWNDPQPTVKLQWQQRQTIRRMVLCFDTDFDHPMETVLMTHPETVMPFCVRDYEVLDESGSVVYQTNGNYQTRNVIEWKEALQTSALYIRLRHPGPQVPAALFEVRCFEK